MKWKACLFWLVVILIVVGVGFAVYRRLSQQPVMGPDQMPPPMVTVAHPVEQSVQDFREFTGTTSAVEEVQIRARIKGYLQKVHFQDGANVRKGDLLFEIEPESYIASRDQATAMLRAAQAELIRTEDDLERVQEAIKVNAVSEQELTSKKAAFETAKAALLGAKAALNEAELNLSYTKIHSPIDGRISRRMVDAGNLVGAMDQTLLATVVRLDPMYIYFDVSENFFLETFGQKTIGPESKQPFSICLENETDFSREGVLNYMDNQLDAGTGTLILRGQLSNVDGGILPGMYVQIRIPVGNEDPVLLIHQRALGTDLDGKYLMIVNEKNQALRRPVKLGKQVGNMTVVKSGLAKEETYVVDGLQFIFFPGMTVQSQMEGQQPSVAPNPQDLETGAADDQ